MTNPQQNPFLGLKPYEPKDRQRLYGRDKDLFLMKDRIFSCRTTLLFAASGVGKTSFINAKIIPDLEAQYCIIYHNQWSIGDPLGALEKSISAKLPDGNATTPAEATNKSLLDHLAFTKPTDGKPGKRCLIILDQFEEIFQYHSRQKYFEHFIDEIASIINTPDCNARVLFSMREEFLGELSIFDNKIPDLFNNYYRLKCPTKLEAEEIVERTCSFVKVPVSTENLSPFVFELTLIDKADLAKDEASAADTFFERDIIAPPFLQIACQRLWDRQYVSGNSANGNKTGDFLVDYKKGDAHSMLRAFCHEILATFNQRDRALLADAFDFLVTKKGAKMAYELSSLAEHMSVKENVLKSVLQKLSLPEKRILRETNAPNDSLWFELYHDMYGPIIDEWKRAYRAERKAALRRKVKQFSAAGLVIVLLVIGIIYSVSVLREYERTLADANLRDPVNYAMSKAAFDNLHSTWGFGRKAKRLWSDAWKRRASLSERTEFSDDALLSWLRAAAEDPKNVDPALTAQINSLLTSDDYQPLMATYRLESDGTASGSGALFSADGTRLLGITKDLRVISYDVGSNQPVGQSQPLDLTRCKARNEQFNAVQPANVLPSSPIDQGTVPNISIQSAAGNLIGGVNGQNVCVWDVESGEVLFPREARDNAPSTTNAPGGYNPYEFPQASISVSPGGNYFASVSSLKQGAIYKVKGKTVEMLYRELNPVESILFSPDKRTALFDQTSAVKLLDLETGAWKFLPLSPRKGYRRILFNSDGSKLLVESGLGDQPELWDIPSGALQKRINAPASGPFAEFYFCGTNLLALIDKVSFDENREVLTITLLNTDTNSVVSTRTSLISKASYKISSSQSAILIIPATGVARLLTLTPRPPGSKLINDPEGMTLRNISDDGQVIATVNQRNVVKLWNAKDVTLSASFQLPGVGSIVPSSQLDQLVVSAKGKYLCYRRMGGSLIIWDNQQQRQILEDESKAVDFGRLVSFSADDRVIAVTGPGKEITFWQDGQVVKYPLKDDPSRIQLSPDGRYLTAIYDYSNVPVRLFDMATFFELRPPMNITPKIAWSSNGTLLAPTANDNELLVWNLSAYIHHTLKHSNTVMALALSSDGTRAVTSTSDRSLHLWDTTNGTLIMSGKLGSTIRQLSLSNDGKSILAASDSWIHLYSIQATGLEYVDGRLIGIRDLPRILDNTGLNLRLVVPLSNDSLEVDDISFAPNPDATLSGSPKDLLETWLRKLSLTFDERGALAQLSSGG